MEVVLPWFSALRSLMGRGGEGERAHQRWQALPWRDALHHGAVAHLGLQGLQAFPAYGLRQEYRSCFEALPRYGRFVRLLPRLLMPFTCS